VKRGEDWVTLNFTTWEGARQLSGSCPIKDISVTNAHVSLLKKVRPSEVASSDVFEHTEKHGMITIVISTSIVGLPLLIKHASFQMVTHSVIKVHVSLPRQENRKKGRETMENIRGFFLTWLSTV
jgi:hypothetical protein